MIPVKLLPVIVTEVPLLPEVGVKLLIVGADEDDAVEVDVEVVIVDCEAEVL